MTARPRYWLEQLLWAALLGLGYSTWQVWNLRRGHLAVEPLDAASIVLAHVVFAVVISLPAIAVCQFLRGLPRQLPPLWVLFSLVFIELRLRFLPPLFTRTTLAVGLALAGTALLLGWAWSRRPWRRAVDRALALVLVVACLVVLLWAPPPPSSGETGVNPADLDPDVEDRPDIYLILVDTLRADHLGLYGYPLPTSPNLDRLATEAVVFEHAYSASNWTRPTVASLLTSTIPSVHNVTQLDRAVSADLPLVTEVLAAAGYSTAVFSSGGNLEPQDGYARGVDHFFVDDSQGALGRTPIGDKILKRVWRKLSSSLGRSTFKISPERLSQEALDWLGTAPVTQPVFVYLHLPGPHAPYLPPAHYASVFSSEEPLARLSEPPRRKWSGKDWLSEADRRQMIAQYDGEILQHDAVVGEFLDAAAKLTRPRDVYYFITADHGEGFGEHGVWGHAVGLFNEITRVPLLVARRPSLEEPGRRATPASLLDLAPTFSELAGQAPPESFQGVSLVPLLETDSSFPKAAILENPLYDEDGLVSPERVFLRGREGLEGAVMGAWLYQTMDIEQLENLTSQFPEAVKEQEQRLTDRLRSLRELSYRPGKIELDDERRDKLRALGYIE